ncbi:MAG: N-acetyltransferase family protein, partial [Pseudomonadota bacterium]
MTFSLQTADNSHVPAITEIYGNSVVTHTASFEFDAPDEAEMASRMDAVLAAGYPYLVAVDDDAQQPEILGYAYASAYRSRPGYLWTVEDTVYIAPQAQGRGIGTALLSAIIAHCEVLGFRQMIAIVGGSDHVASIRLHEKLGFERVGVLPATG